MFNFIQGNAVALVANSVNRNLKFGLRSQAKQLAQLFSTGEQQAAVIGTILVGLN